MKRIVVISASPRVRSNSDLLAEQFMEGAKSAGHEVEKINLLGKDMEFCRGCPKPDWRYAVLWWGEQTARNCGECQATGGI